MTHRVGICSSCRARYQIPANFAHDRARCRSCGGIVEIGPLEGEAAVPAAAPAHTPATVPTPDPAPTAAAAESARAPAPSPPTSIGERSAPPRRSPLVAVIVGGLILAAVVFGAWRLFS